MWGQQELDQVWLQSVSLFHACPFLTLPSLVQTPLYLQMLRTGTREGKLGLCG